VLVDGASVMNLFSVFFCHQRGEKDLENFETLDRTDYPVRSKVLPLIVSAKVSEL
jgi:hypothetical protein